MTFFYDMQKKLQQVLDTSKSDHMQLNERDEGKHNNATTGFKALADKAAKEYGSKAAGERVAGAVRAKMKKAGKLEEQEVEEGLGSVVQKIGSGVKKVAGKALDTLGHGSDEDMIRDLQKKAGLPQTGIKPGAEPNPKVVKEKMSASKAKDFAALAEPKDKITFADKIAGAKKEVDEMLGDVAAEAMKGAVTRKIAGKRYGGSLQKDDEPEVKPAVPRGRGRPKKPTDTEQGAELKPDWSAFGVGKVKLPAHTGAVTKHKLSDKEPTQKVKEEDDSQLKAAIKMLKKAGYKVEKAEEELEEKAVSKKQQKFMGMVHAAQKGEKPASKEVAKVAKTMKKKDAEDFAATKHKGLPEKAPKKKDEATDKSAEKPKKAKKEKTEEAGGSGTPTASSGFSFGKGIYDSMNRELENMIAESMNINISMNSDNMGGPSKSVTVTATDEDAETLSALLQSAGLGAEQGAETSTEVVGENQPDWPTDTVTSDDALQYSGGINKPKSTGQTTIPVIASQDDRQESYAEAEEDAIKRMMEMAGIQEAAKPDFTDVDKDGDKEESWKKAEKDKEEKKVEESIFSLTNLLKSYKG